MYWFITINKNGIRNIHIYNRYRDCKRFRKKMMKLNDFIIGEMYYLSGDGNLTVFINDKCDDGVLEFGTAPSTEVFPV